jgi:hypothetical protein
MQQLSLFDLLQDLKPTLELAELFEAYQACRISKRNTRNALAFEVDYETHLVNLCADINNGSYQPGKSIAFIVNKPVKREIFAADFRDRVVHHLVVSKLNPLFEKTFIYDSYACRVGKGTHLGIQRVDRFIRQCSQNYTTDCYVLKLDIKGFLCTLTKSSYLPNCKPLLSRNISRQIRRYCWNCVKKSFFTSLRNTVLLKVNAVPGRGCHRIRACFILRRSVAYLSAI